MPGKQTASKSEPAPRENKTRTVVDGQSNQGLLSDAVQLARSDSAQWSPQDVIALQRAVGNRAVVTRLQAKLKVGAAHDPYEQEADQMSAQVMHMPEPTQSPLQRQEDEEEIQTKPILQRQEDDDEIQTERTDRMGAFETGSGFDARLQSARGSGQPIPGDVREFMEPRFGEDFSGVHLHSGPQSADLNREVSARAFTLGNDIFLGEGEENISSESGRGLLAHELTHVTQQTGSHPLPGAQRETIQRFLSVEDWKRLSSVAFARRSAALKRIDNAVATYNAIPKSKTDQRMEALTALNQAISAWEAAKGGSSARMAAITDLRRDLDVEFLALTMEMEQNEQAPVEEQPPESEAPEAKQPVVEDEDKEGEDTEEAPLDPAKQQEQLDQMQAEMDRDELETLRLMIKSQRDIIAAWKIRLEMAKQMPPDEVAKVMEDLHEQMEINDQIGEVLGRPLSGNLAGDEGLEAELAELQQGLQVEVDDDDEELRKLEAELEDEESTGIAESGLGFEVDDPDDIADQLANAEEELAGLEEDARQRVMLQGQEGKIVGALLPLFMAYKAKKDEHGAHGIKSERAQEIIETMLNKSAFGDLYELDTNRGDMAIQKAAEMAFGDTWIVRVENGYLSVLNIDADAALKAAAEPVRAECERIAKATPEQLTAAFEVLAQAQGEAKLSGERSLSQGPLTAKTGGSVSGTLGAKATAKVSAEVDKLAKSIKLVAEAAAQAGMGADMTGFISVGLGKHLSVFAEGNLNAFFGVKGEAKASFQTTLREIRAEAEASLMIGAEVSGSAKAGVRMKHVDFTVDAQGEALAGAKADVSGSVVIGLDGISLKGEANAFAGVKASGSVGGSINHKGKQLFSVRAKGEALAGAGASASGEFTFHQGKLHISADVSLTLGLGAGVGTEIEVDFKAIGEAVLIEMQEYYGMIFPPDIDRRSPDGPRESGLTSEERGKLYMAIYPAFAAYGKRKQTRGEHGVKLEVLQTLIDNHVIRNKDLVKEVEQEGGTPKQVPLYMVAESDQVLAYAALSALPGQLNYILIQAGQIRSLEAVKKEDYVGL